MRRLAAQLGIAKRSARPARARRSRAPTARGARARNDGHRMTAIVFRSWCCAVAPVLAAAVRGGRGARSRRRRHAGIGRGVQAPLRDKAPLLAIARAGSRLVAVGDYA